MRTYKTIDEYLAVLPDVRAQRGRALHAAVRSLFPDAKVSFDYGMPTYRRGENFFAWSSQKRYFSAYTCSAERIAVFRRKRPDVPAGVGCLNFRDADVFIAAQLQAVIRAALAPGKALLARELAHQTPARKLTE